MRRRGVHRGDALLNYNKGKRLLSIRYNEHRFFAVKGVRNEWSNDIDVENGFYGDGNGRTAQRAGECAGGQAGAEGQIRNTQGRAVDPSAGEGESRRVRGLLLSALSSFRGNRGAAPSERVREQGGYHDDRIPRHPGKTSDRVRYV